MIDSIGCPADLKDLNVEQLQRLIGQVRNLLITVVGDNGGHLASNLGLVELTVALHRVFDFSVDSLIFDVGHQSYTHKILTGRREKFATLRTKGGITGFPNPDESEYDLFITGHSSTSISCATGLALGKKISGEKSSTVVVIGDGSLGGGMCFEALNHAGGVEADVLVILNDNDMAISRTVGAFARYLEEFRSREDTTILRQEFKEVLGKLPLIGDSADWLYEKMLGALKNHTGAAAVFEAMGFRYFGPFDGHNVQELELEIKNLSKLKGPRILHVLTEKGRGFYPAQSDPEKFHSSAPFTLDKESGKIVKDADKKINSYSRVFAENIIACARRNTKVVAITAAMTGGTGMSEFAEEFADRFFDVGMAESHAITFAAGLARMGFVPVVAIYSTFLQRSYDQIFHDVALQGNLPVVFALDRAGLVGEDGPTHHGIFDIAYLRHLPNMILIAPCDKADFKLLFTYAMQAGCPVAIRYPKGAVADFLPQDYEHEVVESGKAEVLKAGCDGVIFAYGRMVEPAYNVALKLESEKGIDMEVVNARFAKPLDREYLIQAAEKRVIFTIEDHALAGGFGSAVAEELIDAGVEFKLYRFGVPDEFVSAASRDEQDDILGLSEERLFERILAKMKSC